ncbi:MAG: hypothetical protein IKB60_03710 [Clostridia bacterium]|nr:hypothetical protein [Clostridia bacterium]
MARSNRISYDSAGNMLIEGIPARIKEETYKVSDEFKRKLKELELSYKTLAVSEEEYYKKLESLRDTYLQKGTEKWWTYTKKLISYEDNLLKANEKAVEEEKKRIIDVYDDIASHIYKTQESLLKAQSAFTKKLRAEADVSSTKKIVFEGLGSHGEDLIFKETNLEDLEAKKKELKDYYNLLSALKTRGNEVFGESGFYDFFDMVRNLSVSEGAGLSKILLKENDEGFSEFVGDWNEIQSLTDGYAKDLFSGDTKRAINESADYIKRTLEECGLCVPEDFFNSGAQSAIKFGEGFMAEIEGVLNDIKRGFDALLPYGNITQDAKNVSSSESSVYAPVYNLYGSGETVSDMLRTAANQALIDKLRGGYSRVL